MKKLVVLMALLVTAGMLWAQAPAAPAVTRVTMPVIAYIGRVGPRRRQRVQRSARYRDQVDVDAR